VLVLALVVVRQLLAQIGERALQLLRPRQRSVRDGVQRRRQAGQVTAHRAVDHPVHRHGGAHASAR
jgi:hypothetical protein